MMPEEKPDKCCVCSKTQQYPFNRMLICGNCAVTVHQGCYGAQKGTEPSNWFCRKCESQVRISKTRCDLCPIKEGAFKRSSGSRCGWAHVLCAVYFPEAYFKDPESMDLIMLENIPPDRYGRVCVFCEHNQRSSLANHGACIQCAWASCRAYFHVTCAYTAGLLSDLPPFVVNSADSLAVLLSKPSNSNSDLPETRTTSDAYLSVYNSIIHTTCEESVSLCGFCSIKHKEKFSEFISYKPTAMDNLSDANTFSPNDPIRCTGPKHSTPANTSKTNSKTKSSASTSNFMFIKESSKEDPQSSNGNSGGLSEDSDISGNNLKGRCSMKRTDCSDSNPTDLWERNTKYLKAEPSLINEQNLSVTTVESDPFTLDGISSNLHSLRVSVSSHSTEPSKLIENDYEASSFVDQEAQALETQLPNDSASQRKSHSRHARNNLHYKCSSKYPNSRCSIPQRPLPLRGVVLPVKHINRTRGSSEWNLVNSATNPSPGSSQSPLTTMQDLLEWQWDQAGAMLMQQVEGTDVVSLLDCLHQLKSENDSLEAKLLRLKTRQEHLLSVNARLAASLATMESSVTLVPMDNKPPNRAIQLSNSSQEEVTVQAKSTGYPQCTPEVNRRCTTSAPIASSEHPDLGNCCLITATPTFRPGISSITACRTVSHSSSISFSSPATSSTYNHHFQCSAALPIANQWQTTCIGPNSTSPPISQNVNSKGRSKLKIREEQLTFRKQLPNQWMLLPSAIEPSNQFIPSVTSVSSNNLIELSARLSSAIAARQSVPPGISCSNSLKENRCSKAKITGSTNMGVRSSTVFSTHLTSSIQDNFIAPKTVLPSGLTPSGCPVGQNTVTTSQLCFTDEHVPQRSTSGNLNQMQQSRHEAPDCCSDEDQTVPVSLSSEPASTIQSQAFGDPNPGHLPLANIVFDYTRT